MSMTMPDAVIELLKASQALSVADRRLLADAIWESIPIDDGWQPSDAVLAEVHRRLEEHDRDPSSAIGWDEMQERLSKLRQRFQ